MKPVLGIVAEYNPFHKGHLYHLEESKKRSGAERTVVVMSGNFTQRGEGAFADKWLRAEAAVRCGADLVLELPTFYACNSAEYFAQGAIGILKGLGCVSHLSFGSELGDLEPLQKVADLLTEETAALQTILRQQLDKGVSFPRARQEAVKRLAGPESAELLASPNNILAVEYLKVAKRCQFSPEWITVERKGAGYHDADAEAELASASALRNLVRTGSNAGAAAELLEDKLPCGTAKLYENQKLYDAAAEKRFFDLVAYKVLSLSEDKLDRILAAGEGLGYKLKKEINRVNSLEELISAVSSKRYPDSRIRRLLAQLLLGIDVLKASEIRHENRLFARVLAISEEGQALLKEIRKSKCNSIPIITNINKEAAEKNTIQPLLELDILAADLYHLLLDQDRYERSDHRQKPFVLK